MEIILLQYS